MLVFSLVKLSAIPSRATTYQHEEYELLALLIEKQNENTRSDDVAVPAMRPSDCPVEDGKPMAFT